jgi:hypothetical protein
MKTKVVKRKEESDSGDVIDFDPNDNMFDGHFVATTSPVMLISSM